jgi:peptide/nickel transport system permease protein
MAGAAMFVLMVGLILAAPWLGLADPVDADAPNRLASPSGDHPLGTDMLGRDEASRLLHGGRASVMMAITATAGISLLGIVVGVTSGMLGGLVDALLMRVVDVIQAVPTLMVALVAIGVLGPGADKLVIVFVFVGWPAYARVVRGSTLSLRERVFVDAARALGASKPRIIVCHIIPNLVGPITVLTTLDLGRILLGISALSFLGFGVQPPEPEWGRMLADARTYFFLAPHLLIYPGAAISLLVLAVNLCGDGLRDALDVKMVAP